MARMKPCSAVGCSSLLPIGETYCDRHKPMQRELIQANSKRYNRMREDTAENEFYNSPEWRKVREHVMYKYNGLCLWCYFTEKDITIANCIHHIIELKEDSTKSLTTNNLIPLCDSCHNRVHGLYGRNDTHRNKTQNMLRKMKKEFTKTFGAKE